MDGFRIICDLSDILNGIMKRSFLYVDIERDPTVSGLCSRIKKVFNISRNIALMINDVFLPFGESIKIVRADDVVKVVPFDTELIQFFNYNASTTIKNVVTGNFNELTLSAEKINQTDGKTPGNEYGIVDEVPIQNCLPLSKRARTKKSKRKVCDDDKQTLGLPEKNVDNIELEVLPQLATDESTVKPANANELNHSVNGRVKEVPNQNSSSLTGNAKEKSRKRKHKHCITENDNFVLALTELTPEIVSGEMEEPQLAKDESVALFPTNECESTPLSKKRKRTRIRKKKTISSDMPLVSYNQQSYSYEAVPKQHSKTFIRNVKDVSNSMHIRFSLDPHKADEISNDEILDYETTPKDSHQNTSVQVKNTEGENGSERNVTNNSISGLITPEICTPLVVRRAKIDEVQPAEAALTRSYRKKHPEKDDIISFKIWKMDQSYCPQISGVIRAKVLNYCSNSQQVTIYILEGKNHLEQPVGKFSLELDVSIDADFPSAPPAIPDVLDINWQEMLEAEFFL